MMLLSVIVGSGLYGYFESKPALWQAKAVILIPHSVRSTDSLPAAFARADESRSSLSRLQGLVRSKRVLSSALGASAWKSGADSLKTEIDDGAGQLTLKYRSHVSGSEASEKLNKVLKALRTQYDLTIAEFAESSVQVLKTYRQILLVEQAKKGESKTEAMDSSRSKQINSIGDAIVYSKSSALSKALGWIVLQAPEADSSPLTKGSLELALTGFFICFGVLTLLKAFLSKILGVL